MPVPADGSGAEERSPELSVPAAVIRIAATLEQAGFETWCVGGAVRDALLGITHLDWDLATAARPQQVRRLFTRTIPVGIEFGTVGVLDEAGVMHEVTTYRRDVQTDGRHAVVEFGASLDEDLARRDFTINAIAYSAARKVIHDPFGGRPDLDRRIVRAVGDPRERMREDRLRALRAMRFAARFGFEIEPETWSAIVGSAPHLTRLSAERVKQELEKTMDQVERPSRALMLWLESGALRSLIPSLAGVAPVQLAALDHLRIPGPATRPQRRIARLTAMFAPAAVEAVGDIVRDLRFSNQEAAWIAVVIDAWRRLEPVMRRQLMQDSPVAEPELRRWAAVCGRTRLASVLRLAEAFWRAEREAGMPAPAGARVASAYRRAIRIAFRDPIEVADLAVDGHDLEKVGLRGPAVGRTLRALLEMVINDPATNTPVKLLEQAELQARAVRNQPDPH